MIKKSKLQVGAKKYQAKAICETTCCYIFHTTFKMQ